DSAFTVLEHRQHFLLASCEFIQYAILRVPAVLVEEFPVCDAMCLQPVFIAVRLLQGKRHRRRFVILQAVCRWRNSHHTCSCGAYEARAERPRAEENTSEH